MRLTNIIILNWIIFNCSSDNILNSSRKIANDSGNKKSVEYNINYELLSRKAHAIYGDVDTVDKHGRIPIRISAILLYHAMQSSNSIIRMKAATAAGEANDYFSTPYLINLLNDEVSDVRKSAEKSLWKIWHCSFTPKGWEKFWREKTRNIDAELGGALFIIVFWIIFLVGIIKGTIKLWIAIPLLIIVSLYIYIISFTLWFSTHVYYLNGEPIYYQTSHAYVGLCSYKEYTIAKFVQQFFAVIGICILAIAIWQGIHYIIKKYHFSITAVKRRMTHHSDRKET